MSRALVVAALLAGCGDNGSATPDAADTPADATVDTPASALGVLFINEVMTSNTATCADIVGEFDDWIELYNSGAAVIDLGGYTITDEPGKPKKVKLAPGVTVPAHGYKLLWADDQIQGLDHVAFKLTTAGESVTLFAPDGTQLDTYAWTSAAPTDNSYARHPDGTGAFTLTTTPTCGTSNGAP